jgi:hypothetical protein
MAAGGPALWPTEPSRADVRGGRGSAGRTGEGGSGQRVMALACNLPSPLYPMRDSLLVLGFGLEGTFVAIDACACLFSCQTCRVPAASRRLPGHV